MQPSIRRASVAYVVSLVVAATLVTCSRSCRVVCAMTYAALRAAAERLP